MPRAPFHPVNLEDDTTPGDAYLVAALGDKETELIPLSLKCPRPEVGGGGSGEGWCTSDDPLRPARASPPSDQASNENLVWNPAMSLLGFQVCYGNNVGDDPKVAYELLNGTLLPRDAQELPKDLKNTLGSACQLHIQVPNWPSQACFFLLRFAF